MTKEKLSAIALRVQEKVAKYVDKQADEASSRLSEVTKRVEPVAELATGDE